MEMCMLTTNAKNSPYNEVSYDRFITNSAALKDRNISVMVK